MRKRKMTNNDLQNITQKAKYQTTRTPLKRWGEFRFSGMVFNQFQFCSICDSCDVFTIPTS